MFDNIKLKIEILPVDFIEKGNGFYELFGLEFTKNGHRKFVATRDSLQNSGLGKLRITVLDGLFKELHIENSLHKISSNGINWDDFTLTQFQASVSKLSDIFGVNIMTATVYGRIELGVNLKVDKNYFKQAVHHPVGEKVVMKDGKKAYGVRFDLSTKRIKLYSPFLKIEYGRLLFEKKPKVDVLRCEISEQVSVLRGKGIGIRTVGDLFDKSILAELGVQIEKDFSKVRFNCGLPDDTTLVEIRAYTLFTSEDLKVKDIRKRVQKGSTLTRDKKCFNDLLARSNPPIDIEHEIRDVWHRLITS